MGRVAVELDDAANRVTLQRWPGTILVKDVRAIDDPMVQQWSLKFLQVAEVHLWAGWPCVDLSAVRFGRLNLDGPQSSLFWEIPRVKHLLERHFGSKVVVKHVLENVASMDESAARQISSVMGVIPYRLDCADAVPMRRPRFAWTSEKLETVFPDVSVEAKRYWNEVTAQAPYPLQHQWISDNFQWKGGEQGVVLPTCMKSIPRAAPPPKPAGLEKCTQGAIQRWREDSFRYPPYQYDGKYVFTSHESWRLVNATEKELLLGYGFNHTLPAWSASKVKSNQIGFSDCRNSLLGDSFSIYSFIILAAACARRYLPTISYKFLCQRMGLAPGFRAVLKSQAPLMRQLNYGTSGYQHQNFSLGVNLLNRFLLRKTNHTGSDVRVVSGEILNPRSFPRQSVASGWWRWQHVFKTKWKQKAHINVLELETILLGIKFQISRLRACDQRIFQLSDSYVYIHIHSHSLSTSQILPIFTAP